MHHHSFVAGKNSFGIDIALTEKRHLPTYDVAVFYGNRALLSVRDILHLYPITL